MALLGLTVDEETARRVTAGLPVVDVARVPGAAQAEPGRPVRLLEGRGRVVACGVTDPENEVVRVWARGEVRAFDAAFFKSRVKAAWELRTSLGLPEKDAAYRVFHGDGDGLSGITADAYGPFVVLYAYSKGLLPAGRQVAQALLEVGGFQGVVVKLRARGGAKPGQVKQDVVGVEPPESMTVKELGIPLEVHPLAGLNVGLFTDMREHRRNIARFVTGKRVLNTFAYTGAISVAAARAGASAVTSVDLSSGVLKWAAENFRLSGLAPDHPRYKFETSDVARFMERAVEAGETYDVVVMDPPTVSAARAHSWSMKKDYPELIANAARLMPADKGGVLWVSANAHGGAGVMKHIEKGMELSKRDAVILEVGGLPPDHPTPVAYPESRYLEVVYLRVLPEA